MSASATAGPLTHPSLLSVLLHSGIPHGHARTPSSPPSAMSSRDYAAVQEQMDAAAQQTQQTQQQSSDSDEQYYAEQQQQFGSYDESQAQAQAQAQQPQQSFDQSAYEHSSYPPQLQQPHQAAYTQASQSTSSAPSSSHQQQHTQQHYSQQQHPQQAAPLSQSARDRPPSAASSVHGGEHYSQQPLRPVVPPGMVSSGGVGGASASASPWASQGRAGPAVIDPRSTPEYQIAWELEVWRRSEQARLEAEWRAQGEARMRVIEDEWKKRQLADEAQHASRMVKVRALEKKLQSGLFELQQQERLLRIQEGELASRVASLDRELKRVESDAEAKIVRARDHAKHEVAKSKMLCDELTESLDKKKADLKASNAKLAAVQAELDQTKSKLTKSTVGELRLALERKELERKRTEDDLANMVTQRDSALTRLQLALDKACELKAALESKEHEKLELERKDMERLRVAYLAKTESQGLRRDMGELMEIKRAVRQHLQASQGPARTPVTAMPELAPGASGALGVPEWSAASPHFASFNPVPQTQTGSAAGSIGRTHPSAPVSQANAVPLPYHYFAHEKEVLQKVQSEGIGNSKGRSTR